jgi:hypothetical protein
VFSTESTLRLNNWNIQREKYTKNKYTVMDPEGAQYQEQLCWRRPEEIYWIGLRVRTVSSGHGVNQ